MEQKLLNQAKVPIPILANNSSHSYVIMPALLSNNESELQTPFHLPPSHQNFNNHTLPVRKSPKTNTTQENQNSVCSNNTKSLSTGEFNNFRSHQVNNISRLLDLNNNDITRNRSNKELIYATKKMSLQHSSQNDSSTLDKYKETNNGDAHDSQNFSSNFINSSAFECFRLNNQRIDQTIAENMEDELNNETSTSTSQQNLIKKPQVINRNNINFSKYVNNCSATVNLDKTDTLLNMAETDSSSFFTDSLSRKSSDQSFSDLNSSFSCFDNQLIYNHSDIFNEKYKILSAMQSTERSTDLELFKKAPDESVGTSCCTKKSCISEHHPVLTYEISCSPDLQVDLNRMVNCFVLFKDIRTSESLGVSSDNLRLKCSICQYRFCSLSDLISHKEANDLCKNSLNIENEIDENQGQNKKRKRKKYPTSMKYDIYFGVLISI